jgi:transposase-like protein
MPRHRTAPYLPRRRRWTVADARAALAALGESGLTASAFAQQEGLDPERLRRWRRRLQPKEHDQAAAAAAPPEVIELRPRRFEPVEVLLCSGLVVRVSETIDVTVLARLVAGLEKLGC